MPKKEIRKYDMSLIRSKERQEEIDAINIIKCPHCTEMVKSREWSSHYDKHAHDGTLLIKKVVRKSPPGASSYKPKKK